MVKKGLKIYLFRHGRTKDNVQGKFSGWRNSKLVKSGKDDAKIIALRLKDKKIDIAFQTELSRSKDTLKEVLKFHPECREIITANRVIERNYGELSGKTHLDVVKETSPAQYDKWHRGWDNRPPQGESFQDVEKRVKKFIDNLKKYMKKHQVNVAISAHGNSIRLFRKIIEHKSKKDCVSWFIPYDDYFEYDV